MKALVVGTVAYDTIETSFGKREKILGGSATYITLASSYFCKKTHLISIVGKDFKKRDIEILKRHKSDLSGLEIEKNDKTFFWHGKYHKNMNKRDTIETQTNVLDNYTPKVPAKHQKTDILMLGNLMPTNNQKVIDSLTKKPKIIVLDTMNFWMDNFWEALQQNIKHTDLITINDEESLQLTGEKNIKKAAKKIQKQGPKYIVIKKGSEGASFFHKDQEFKIPSFFIKKVLDPTGAGDSFAGGLIGHLAESKKTNPEEILKGLIKGSAIASFCVEKFGPEGLYNIKKTEIKKRIKNINERLE